MMEKDEGKGLKWKNFPQESLSCISLASHPVIPVKSFPS